MAVMSSIALTALAALVTFVLLKRRNTPDFAIPSCRRCAARSSRTFSQVRDPRPPLRREQRTSPVAGASGASPATRPSGPHVHAQAPGFRREADIA